jgi:hypothetical protein
VSSFNRPALPNQTPAHTQPPRPPAQAQHYSPTVRPSSGQPLLHRGKLLVYSDGFVCYKCRRSSLARFMRALLTCVTTDNTGYKAYDPSAPHMRVRQKRCTSIVIES